MSDKDELERQRREECKKEWDKIHNPKGSPAKQQWERAFDHASFRSKQEEA